MIGNNLMKKTLLIALLNSSTLVYAACDYHQDYFEENKSQVKQNNEGLLIAIKNGSLVDGIVCDSFPYKVETPYIAGKREGAQKTYYEKTGRLYSETFYINNKAEGVSKAYYEETGKLWYEENFKNGFRHGVKKTYYENGALNVEVTYQNDKKEGLERFYYESGKLSLEEPFKDGMRNGIAKMYYENGALKAVSSYKNQELDGEVKIYDQGGVLREEAFYVNGIRQGSDKRYRSNGKLMLNVLYKDDLAVSGICYHTTGVEVMLTNAEISNWNNKLKVKCE